MELIVIALFCAGLVLCVALDLSILYALVAGLILFWAYGLQKGHSLKQLWNMSLSGVLKVKNILITFFLIGMLTAAWRASGTIAYIVCAAGSFIRPQIFYLMTFILNCLISLLIGTSFGTAATMGVICVTMARSMGINVVIVCGAMLSGTFFGDRCSPVSTSALLISQLTGTDIFDNIKNMVRSCVVPFIITCAVYFALGMGIGAADRALDLRSIFGTVFNLTPIAVIPAAVVVVMSVMKIKVKPTMAVSILTALPIAVIFQGVSISNLPQLLFWGFTTADSSLAPMINGGGIVSMLRVVAIVCISSAYSGIFEKTGLLDSAIDIVNKLAEKSTPFIATAFAGVAAGMIGCNQTLAIMLTHQLCRKLPVGSSRMALTLEDTVVLTSPLIPWSIASGAPLASVGGPAAAIVFACFLYIMPLYHSVLSMAKKRRCNTDV